MKKGERIMKKVLIITLIFMLVFGSQAMATVKTNIIELPDVKIVIDGILTKFNDVPVSVSSSTLLPLREMLVKLGVPNDDEHIKYNNLDKSVTVLHEGVSIYLSVGNKTAYVNDEPVALNAAPLLYSKNQRIYIPFRFVAEALDKKVVWDGSTRTIYVCGKESYENVKKILEKSDKAMKNSPTYTQFISIESNVSALQGNMKFIIDITSKLDKIKKALFMTTDINMVGMVMSFDTYYVDNIVYSYDPFSDSWEKTIYGAEEYEQLFEEQSESIMIEIDEPICAGLYQDSIANNEIVLKGDVFYSKAMNKALDSQNETNFTVTDEDMEFDSLNMEMIIDSNTYRIKSMVLKGGYIKDEKVSETTDMSIKVEYSDYDSNDHIEVPAEIKDYAAIADMDNTAYAEKNGVLLQSKG